MTNVEIIQRSFDIIISDNQRGIILPFKEDFKETEFYRFVRFLGYSDLASLGFPITKTLALPYVYNGVTHETTEVTADHEVFTFRLPNGTITVNTILFLEELDSVGFETSDLLVDGLTWPNEGRLHFDEYDLRYIVTDNTGQYLFELDNDNEVVDVDYFTLLPEKAFVCKLDELKQQLTHYLKK